MFSYISRIILQLSRKNTKPFRGIAHGSKSINREPLRPIAGVIVGKCHVIDGDTISIKRTKLRLAGVNAPELDDPWGQKAKWAMVSICKGQKIRAELSGEKSYDRLIATCFLPDGRDIGAELIKLGLALDGGHFSSGKYRHLEPSGIRKKLTRIHWLNKRS